MVKEAKAEWGLSPGNPAPTHLSGSLELEPRVWKKAWSLEPEPGAEPAAEGKNQACVSQSRSLLMWAAGRWPRGPCLMSGGCVGETRGS